MSFATLFFICIFTFILGLSIPTDGFIVSILETFDFAAWREMIPGFLILTTIFIIIVRQLSKIVSQYLAEKTDHPNVSQNEYNKRRNSDVTLSDLLQL
eukprot:TRINITY_DN944_c0_g1_i1.p1 TRINITY_DN944_c0_g1~~TRINITY_DN944_c0_g1_i1.p1  ORF type:complete len:98 (+),score=19.19 TRINITY_DN944_c0_g1_i1:47-340(+)